MVRVVKRDSNFSTAQKFLLPLFFGVSPEATHEGCCAANHALWIVFQCCYIGFLHSLEIWKPKERYDLIRSENDAPGTLCRILCGPCAIMQHEGCSCEVCCRACCGTSACCLYCARGVPGNRAPCESLCCAPPPKPEFYYVHRDMVNEMNLN